MEALKRACVRPRQVRYQAALRPDWLSFDSTQLTIWTLASMMTQVT